MKFRGLERSENLLKTNFCVNGLRKQTMERSDNWRNHCGGSKVWSNAI